jgi:hypothetical protein
LEERLKKLENEIKILKITSGAPSDGSGVDLDQMSQLLKMINDLGDELRADADHKYVGLDKYDDQVRKNDDEHKDMQQDINHICIRLKLLEDFKTASDEHNAKFDAITHKVEKDSKKHEKQLEDIIYQLSQLSSRPSPSGLSNPVTIPGDNGDIMRRMEMAIDEKMKKLGGGGGGASSEVLANLLEQVKKIEDKQVKDSGKLDQVDISLGKV